MSKQPSSFTFDRYAAVFASPKGPGDARPTALQIVRDEGLINGLQDQTMLITGPSAGIGVETTRALAATGARLILCVRNLEKGKATVDSIEASHPVAKGRLELVIMDNADLASVKKAAKEILSKTDKLNVLVFNAGVGATPQTYTKDGFELALQTNYLSHFLLFQLLKPLLLSSAGPKFASRVVMVSSLAHRMGTFKFDDPNFKEAYDPAQSYGSSKTACQWCSNEIERRYGDKGLHSMSLHPGGIMGTNFMTYQDPGFVANVMEMIKTQQDLMASIMNVEQGSATTVLAAISRDFEGQGGLYLEDCQTSFEYGSTGRTKEFDQGYAPYAFDEASEKKLWAQACEWLSISDE